LKKSSKNHLVFPKYDFYMIDPCRRASFCCTSKLNSDLKYFLREITKKLAVSVPLKVRNKLEELLLRVPEILAFICVNMEPQFFIFFGFVQLMIICQNLRLEHAFASV
jgi:hypothetical protein